MSTDIIDDPCSAEGSRFDPMKPTITQRKWLTQQVIDGKMSAKEIKLKYGVSNYRVNNWVCQHRKGNKRRSVGGRPRALDHDSIKSITDWIHEDSSNSQDTKELKKKIEKGYEDSQMRLTEGKSSKNICNGTLINYLGLFQDDNCFKIDEVLNKSD